ncbi:LYR motif-containing protein 4, partial [Phenoliferia sp. Uapishka_3]
MSLTSSTSRSLAHLPRSLRLSPTTTITRTHLLALYREQLRIANSFESYNFKTFFVRKTQDKFRTQLPSLLDSAYSGPSTSTKSSLYNTNESPAEEPDSIYAPTSTPVSTTQATTEATPETRLREWYAEALSDLGVMARSAIVNRLYEAPKLVIETSRGASIQGGGGAGAEAR